MVALFALSLVERFFPVILGFDYISGWLCWFVMGMMVYLHEDRIFGLIRKWHLIWGLIVVYILTGVFYYTEYGDTTVSYIIASASAVMGIWYICRLIPWKRYKFTNVLLTLSACSFGIYLLHGLVEPYMFSRTAKNLFPIVDFAESHIYLFPFLFSVIAFTVSFVLTWLLRKTRVGRFLIG